MPLDGQTYTGDPILAVIDRVDRLICDEEHWWQAGSGRDNAGILEHCPVTAFQEGVGMSNQEMWASPAWQYIVRALPPGAFSVPTYNNAPERKFSDIQALIAKARELRMADIMETVDA